MSAFADAWSNTTAADKESCVKRDDIAIVGMGCRLPGGVDSPAALWRLLVEERDAVGDPPAGRWEADAFVDPVLTAAGRSVPRQGGYLEDVSGFDADFFGVSHREAAVLDPQHRLLLEVAWEALDNAGLPADRLEATPTGVFTGLSYTDYMDRLAGHPDELEGSVLTNGICVAGGRISYLLGLRGPSMSVDTACSSSLVAVHLACQSLRSGECTVALAGGVTLMLWPRVTKSFVRMGMLSPTSRCHTFDAAADGFVRGEGCGVVVLKRLADANRDGDRVLAVIRGSAVNQDGHTDGLTVPSAQAQYEVAAAALRRAEVDPAEVGLVEAHGTGTKVGDPVEFAALSRAYGTDGARCALGSVKTNLGHLEPAAGVAGLIKAVLCLRHGQIPANLHFIRWNPAIDADGSRFFVPTGLTDWPGAAPSRLAAVSSFGFSGTNAHLVLEQATAGVSRPPIPAARTPARAEHESGRVDGQSSAVRARGARGPEVVLVPAGSPAVLPAAAARLADWLEREPGDDAATGGDPAAGAGEPARGAGLRDVAYTSARRRSPGNGRLAVVAASRKDLIRDLRAYADGRLVPNVVSGAAARGVRRGAVWVFSGQGSQWAGMGADLLDAEPVFSAALAEVDPLIAAEAGFSVLEVLRRREAVTGCDRVQPLLFAVQIGLAALWRAHRVEPAAVIGHSMGETAAAVVAGALTLADGVRVICRRSRLLTRVAGLGAMATVGLDRYATEAELAAAGASGEVAVAVLAAPGSTVVSGAADRIRDLVTDWTARGLAAHQIAVDVASHSPQVDPLLADLTAELAELRPRPAEVRFYSTAAEDPRGKHELDAAYWCANLRRTVRFSDAVTAAAADGHRVFVEISPHPVVTRSVTDILAAAGREPVVLPTLRRDEDGVAAFRTSLATAHCAGVPVDWSVLYPTGDLVDLPTISFDRRRHWADREAPAAAPSAAGGRGGPATLDGREAVDRSLPGEHLVVPGEHLRHVWRADAGTAVIPWLADHRVHDRVVLPGAAYCSLAVTAAAEVFEVGPARVRVTGIAFEEVLYLGEHTEITMTVAVTGPGEAECEIHARAGDGAWTRHMAATVTCADDDPPPDTAAGGLAELAGAHPRRVGPARLYEAMRERGIHHGPAFTALSDLHLSEDGRSAWAGIGIPTEAYATEDALAVHPVLLDAAAQTLLTCMPGLVAGSASGGLVLPAGTDSIRIHGDPATVRYCHARLDATGTGTLTGEVRLLDEAGALVVAIDGMRLVHQDGQRLLDGSGYARASGGPGGWIYGIDWEPSPRPEPAQPRAAGRWLLLGDESGSAGALGTALSAAGADVDVQPLPGPDDARRAWAASLTGDDGGAVGRRVVVVLDGATAQPAPGAQVDPSALVGSPFPADPARAQQQTMTVLGVAAALAELPGVPPGLTVVTRGAHALAGNAAPDLDHGGIRGLLRVLTLEHPELRAAHIDADPGPDMAAIAAELLGDVHGARSGPADDEVALRAGVRFVARLTPAPVTAAERGAAGRRTVRYGHDRFALQPPGNGNLDDLRLVAADRRPPGHGEVEVRVQAAGLNFRDVLICLGALPQTPIGFECAGVVTAVGPGITDRRPGDAVLAVNFTDGGAFGSFLTIDADLTMPVPAGLDPATAAGIPTGFLTAWYALRDVAQLRAGERVLIHSGTGGTGLAAIAVARLLGAEVLATAGTPEKRAYLRGMGITHVMDSRSVDFSAQTLAATGGQGVDVVLNSLSGPAIRAGMECLRPFGRFVELGLRDILADSALGLAPFRNSITFAGVNLIELYRHQPERVARLLRELTAALAAGELAPLPVTTYPIEAATDAFRLMAGAAHIGKVVLEVPGDAVTEAVLPDGPPSPVGVDGSYIVTGGLRGVGLETAAWLAEKGAARVVLNGRSEPAEAVRERIAKLVAGGTDVQVVLGDVAEPGVAERLVAAATAGGGRLRGAVHAAMVLDDAALTTITADQVRRVWHPKTFGAWRLHEATAGADLDWFVLYSSMASLLGNPGQGAYAAANSWLDGFADWRCAQGLATTVVNWGPWAEVGAATDFAERGYAMIPVRVGLAALETLLVHGRRRAGVLPGEPGSWIPTAGRSSSLFARFVDDEHAPSAAAGSAVAVPGAGGAAAAVADGPGAVLAGLRAVAPGLPRRTAFEAYLTEHLRAVLRLGQSVLDPDIPLRSLGFDSLLALELRSRLEPGLGISLPGNFIWKYDTVATLAAGLADHTKLPLDGGE
ncbi:MULTISPECIES: type I polyketide synthase [unclassified Parafrankia]|uniref:type I polyketide synthase n=1 Tax=unclassified Parafrankia TaxID=2994368 RepID=UPI000DA55F8E|nr:MULTISPECIES: type I polyketide synthase [unclassified Parafrankia]TCJ35236.1 SDR family NAD(P)-dependent oxidoreductase [Parafrankia sp. BMG5.11]SQD99868.1 Phthioceranic/hydroxyphthioceranic acid synthase [Parafrankia sp. Ea1.12]